LWATDGLIYKLPNQKIELRMNLRVANTSWHWIDMHSKIQNMMEKKIKLLLLGQAARK
jgi:hypothetical protein